MNQAVFHSILRTALCRNLKYWRIRDGFVTCSAAPKRYRDEWREDGMGIAFALEEIDRYCHDGADLYQILCLAKQCHLVALLRANKGGDAGPIGVDVGEEEVPDIVAVEKSGKKIEILAE